MAPHTRETTALVFGCLDHGESDKIITIFSRDLGRVTGIAKGANRSKKRFQNKLELFSHVTLSYNERPHSTLIFIADAELHDSFMKLRRSVDCYIAATLIRETLLMAVTDREGDEGVFALLLWSLQAMDNDQEPLGVTAIFLLRFFDRIGYRPDLTHCRSCEKPFIPGDAFSFQHMTGGLVCSDCCEREGGGCSELSSGTIRLLATVLDEPLERLHRLKFSRQALRQALAMLHRYGRNLFQRDIQSWKALRPMLQ